LPITAGSIDSMEPLNPILLTTPSPNISGSLWHAVSATNTSGHENTDLTQLIQAVDTTYFNNPTPLTSILGGPNDDIVSLDSQQAGGPLSFVVFNGLAHSAAFGDPSVTNAPEAIKQTLCWLNIPAGASCNVASRQVTAETADTTERLVVGRLSIVNHPLTGQVGQRTFLTVHASGLTSLELEQQDDGGNTSSDEIKSVDPTATSHRIQMIPKVIGDAAVTVRASFSDGGHQISFFKMSNTLDSTSIDNIVGFGLPKLIMPRVGMTFRLDPVAKVSGIDDPIEVRSISRYQVISALNDPPIGVDGSGVITSLHAGRAVVRVLCEGHSDDVAVEVK